MRECHPSKQGQCWHCTGVNGVYGWADDDLAFIRPWWLAANVPGCVVKTDDVAGHLGRDPVEEISEEMRWLRDGTALA